MPETINPPTETQINDLVRTASPFGLLPEVQRKIVDTLAPFVQQAGEIAREAEGVTVTDATQTEAVARSRALRLKLQKVRTGADKARKGLKEEFLRPGQAIDAAGRHILSLIDPVETRLENQEKIVERQEAEKKAALKRSRETMLQPYGCDSSMYDLANMSDAAFGQLLDGQAALHAQRREQAEREAKARAEADRIRTEQEAATRAENERLRQERAAADAAAAAERAEAAKALAAANAARAKAEAEAKALADQQAAKAKAEAAAARKAARAPDAAKLKAYAKALFDLPLPEMKDANLNPIVGGIIDRRNQLVNYINQRAAELD